MMIYSVAICGLGGSSDGLYSVCLFDNNYIGNDYYYYHIGARLLKYK